MTIKDAHSDRRHKTEVRYLTVLLAERNVARVFAARRPG